MALFNKNPNEAAYVGGKKHWTDVIKNCGSGELLIWRQPRKISTPILHWWLCPEKKQSLLKAVR